MNNGIDPSSRRARKLCLDAFESALNAVEPRKCLHRWLSVEKNKLHIGSFNSSIECRRIIILAVGKASVPMLKTTLDSLGKYEVSPILVTPKGSSTEGLRNRSITIFQAGHPIPNRESVKAGRFVGSTIQRMKKDDLLLCLISGGASALLVAPPKDITLKAKLQLTSLLIKSNATIHEINTVRRHLSELKGGRLVEKCPATIVALIMSDVVGNFFHDIGSGLTAPDPTTYTDALGVLERHNLTRRVSKTIMQHLEKGAKKRLAETVKPQDERMKRIHNFIIADNRTACEAAARTISKRLPCRILTSSAEMDARCMGKLLGTLATDRKLIRKSRSIVIGGETTVSVSGIGVGGRNQEVTLSALDQISGRNGTVVAAIGTDGIDGNSPAAGAIIDGYSKQRCIRLRIDPDFYLKRNDSYHFFRRLHDNIVTGRTGTNVGDLYLLIRV